MTTLLCINPASRFGNECDRGGFKDKLSILGPVVLHELAKENPVAPVIHSLGSTLQRIIVGGGDGTINRALSDVCNAGVPLGILPLGTANDLARSLQLDLDPLTALDAVLEGNLRTIDLCEANEHLFVNAAGIGLGPDLTEYLDDERKKRLGVLAYLMCMVEVFGQRRNRLARLTIDGKTKRMAFLQITIANGIHYGGGLTISEDAQLHDEKLRILCIKPQTILQLIGNFFTLRWGVDKDESPRNMKMYSAKQVKVETRQPIDVTLDGELVTQTPLVCCLKPKAIKVYAPKPGAPSAG